MKTWVDSAVGIRSTAKPVSRPDTLDASGDYLARLDGVTSGRRFTSLPPHFVHHLQPIRVVSRVASCASFTGAPVVALESSVLAQGLPIPQNRDAAERMVGAVERVGCGAGDHRGRWRTPTVGLRSSTELERFLRRDGVRKVSARDLPFAMATKADGATTVSCHSSVTGESAGIFEVFATGGIGGVHRDAPFDESAGSDRIACAERR